MGSRLAFAGVLVARAARADRRTTLLSIGLVALPVAAASVLLLWTPDPAVLAVPVVAALVWVALAVGEPARDALAAQLWINGGLAGTRAAVVAAQAALVGGLGSLVGAALGLAAVRLGGHLLAVTPPDLGPLFSPLIAGLAGTAVAGALSTLLAVGDPTLRSLDGRSPSRRVLWWWAGPCLVMIWGATFLVGQSHDFANFNLAVVFTGPLVVLGTVGLASIAVAALGRFGPRGSGPRWFAMRSVGRDRRRTGLLAGLIAVVVGIGVVGAIFGASFTEREARARADFAAGVPPTWTNPVGTPRPVLGSPEFANEVLYGIDDPEHPDFAKLGRSRLVQQDAADAWLLAAGILGFLVPVVATAVALNASVRRRDDELLALQGAGDSWARRANAVEAFALSAVGVAVGAGVAITTTAYGFSLYNSSTRLSGRLNDGQPRVYPPVPFVVPWGVVALLVVGVPVVAAVVAALLTRPVEPRRVGAAAEAVAAVPA